MANKQCVSCDGTGYVTYTVAGYDGEPREEQDFCGNCNEDNKLKK